MSTIRWGTIMCNRCHTHSPQFRAMRGDPGAQAMRRKLAKQGWTRVPGDTARGRDYCPPCTAIVANRESRIAEGVSRVK
jgi:hypothetical protein